MRIDVIDFHEYNHLQMNSIDDAMPIINAINQSLEDEEYYERVSLLFLGFSEMKYFLEAGNQVGGLLHAVPWYTSDAVFDESVIDTTERRISAERSRLTGIYYMGFKPDQQIDIRSDTLEAIYRQSGSVDLLSIFSFDSTMLIYQTLERMGDVVGRTELFPSYILQTSSSSYGATGYLGITSTGFRKLGEYIAGGVTEENETRSTMATYSVC